jgi:hypothetical protein
MENVIFAQVVMDRSLLLPFRLAIWRKADDVDLDLKRFAYDRVRPVLERELATSHYGRRWTIDQLIPEPAGMEQHRALAAQREEQRARELDEQRYRDEASRTGAGD